MDLFSKSRIVGVSVTPEIGLEVAEIDYANKTVLKYASRPLDYNANLRQIADMDIFKETLQDLFIELEINKNAQVVLNMPALTFKAAEYPAMMDEVETINAITETLLSMPAFENEEPCFSAAKLPISSMQFNKFVYTAARHNLVSEVVMAIKDLGYKVYAIDTSVSSIFNALRYIDRVSNIEPDTPWIMLMVDASVCRVIPMLGYSAMDVYEERISIGEVLGDAENYSTVLSTIQPILKNTPSKYLYVVSETNIISAEILAGKIQYGSPIIHQEANSYNKEPFMTVSPEIDPVLAQQISLSVIGAAIRRDVEAYNAVNLNLFNKSLGDLYLMEQPPEITILGKTYVLSIENLLKIFIVILILALVAAIPIYMYLSTVIRNNNNEVAQMQAEITKIDAYLAENSDISSNEFDEGDEIKTGLVHNKGIYSYYTIVGTEIPKKLWLTHLKLGDKTTIEGQADNLESIYGFYRSIKDYDAGSDIKLQKLGLAQKSSNSLVSSDGNFDTESILTSLNADFYEFRISNEPEVRPSSSSSSDNDASKLPELEPATN